MSSDFAAEFPSTSWTIIRHAQDRDSPEYLAALNRCMASYWKPVFYFLKAKRIPHQRAEDLTQEFFLHFLERDWIRRADPERGRFRTYLLTVLTRFVADQQTDRAPRQKRFDDRLVAVSALVTDAERNFEPPDNRTPDEVFMGEWARAVLASVQAALENWCRHRGRPDWFSMFRDAYLADSGCPRLTQQALAERLGVSRDQVRYGLEEVNRQFVELLRAEVAEQVGSDDDLEAEILQLESLLEK